ncbi:aminotransferase class I/II-fold pyridoxal phosphate-dependent enzyme [Gemmata sp. SH-PL17]|uniref:aminotransferase class I/II-fold pyridoxal phosphate-dependent enzyme n=1 Tax=Gemmata sp. SH-PL17 TaxID=1630693 RepID=UPI001EF60D18|nr:aminotransferase class I/II-fold pyridoxal phosphate-dependent enzyme [Gemmata sp. SH-PL17]
MLASRVQHFTESVIREMSRIAQQYGAINLGQGMPDFDPPEEVKEAACRAVRDGFNQYAVTWGIASLRKAIAAKMRAFNGLEWVDADAHVTVCCGARVHDGDHARADRPGRRGGDLPALLRELRTGRETHRSDSEVGVAPLSGLVL